MPATVSLRTAWTALGAIAVLGLAAIVAALSVPLNKPSVPQPGAAALAPGPLKVAAPTASPAPPVPAASYRVASYLQRPERFEHGAWIWNDDNVPAGPMMVLVDTATQLMHVFQGGREIGVAVVLYGADDSPTPLGVHSIRWKKARHTSSIFGSPMPYTLNLTDDGIAVHGSNVRWGWGTNGCIGIPETFAKLLFERVAVGDKVVVMKGGTPSPGQNIPLV